MFIKWLILCPTLGLAAGLTACGKDNIPGESDGFRVKNPIWQSGTETKPFRDRKENSVPLKFSDALMIDDDNVRLHSEARCIVGHEEFKRTTLLPSAKRFLLLSMLPKEVLKPDMMTKENPLRCSFNFEFSNELGSRHRDGFRELFVEDDSEQTFQINWPEKEKRVFDSKDLKSIRLFAINNEPITPTILCSIQKSLAHQRGEKPEFFLSDYNWKNDFKITTTDQCRVLGKQKGLVTMISRTFQITFVVAAPGQILPQVGPCQAGSGYLYGLRRGDGNIMYNGDRPICRDLGVR